MDEQNSKERRSGDDRRKTVVDRRLGLDRKRGPGKRVSEERKAAEEGQMSDEQFEFLTAIDQYKRTNSRPFPTWTEVLEVIKALGYRKVAEPQSLQQFKKEDKPKRVSPRAKKEPAPSRCSAHASAAAHPDMRRGSCRRDRPAAPAFQGSQQHRPALRSRPRQCCRAQ